MTTVASNQARAHTNKDRVLTAFLWALAILAALTLFYGLAHASAAGGGTALLELNTWLEDEIGGSIGTTVGLVSFLVGLITAVAQRTFMPLIWGMGIGITIGIFLNVVVAARSAGLPVALMVRFPLMVG